MPLRPQSLDNRIRYRFATLTTFCAEAIRVAPHTPSVPFLLYERSRRVEWVTALRAEEMANVPLGATGYHDLALNGRLAALAPGREELVEVEMAVEAQAFVETVFGFETVHVFKCGVGGEELDVFAALAGVNASNAFGTLVVGLGVEGYAF